MPSPKQYVELIVTREEIADLCTSGYKVGHVNGAAFVAVLAAGMARVMTLAQARDFARMTPDNGYTTSRVERAAENPGTVVLHDEAEGILD